MSTFEVSGLLGAGQHPAGEAMALSFSPLGGGDQGRLAVSSVTINTMEVLHVKFTHRPTQGTQSKH